MLCDNCSTVNFQWFEDIAEASAYAKNPVNQVFARSNKYVATTVEEKYYIHQPNFKCLAHSKDSGCYVCAALWFAFKSTSCEAKQDAIDFATAGDVSPASQSSQVVGDAASERGDSCPVVWMIYASRQERFASDIWFHQQETVSVYCGRFCRKLFRVKSPEGKYRDAFSSLLLTSKVHINKSLTRCISCGSLKTFLKLITPLNPNIPWSWPESGIRIVFPTTRSAPACLTRTLQHHHYRSELLTLNVKG